MILKQMICYYLNKRDTKIEKIELLFEDATMTITMRSEEAHDTYMNITVDNKFNKLLDVVVSHRIIGET